MRIAFYTWESLHSLAVGGVAVHVTELAAALQRRGHEVHVFTRMGEGQTTYQLIDGIHYHRCPIELHPDCVPSRNEPFGIVVLEAWAAGKPVVVTRNGGPAETVTHNLDGIVAYANPNSICWAIKEIFRDFAHSRWMGERGRVKAAYSFNWDEAAAQTEGIYSEIIR